MVCNVAVFGALSLTPSRMSISPYLNDEQRKFKVVISVEMETYALRPGGLSTFPNGWPSSIIL